MWRRRRRRAATATAAPAGAPLPGAPVVAVRGLTYRYEGGRGLDGLDLQAGPGECVALLGPNGSGKTTALECIAGLLSPTAGSLRVCGTDPQVDPDALAVRRALAFVGDAPVFYRSFTVAEHLELVGAAHGAVDELGRGAWAERARALLRDFGLGGHRDALPHQLSAGLRQRTGLACAFARPFDVLVLDEPTLRLDPRGQSLVAALVEEAVAAGATVLVATHAAGFARAVADRAVILEDGAVVAAGGWQEVEAGPAGLRLGLST